MDIILTAASVLGAYALRFELGKQFYDYLPSALWMIGAAVILKPFIYYLFGIYRRMWSYASVSELKLIIAAVTTASVFT
ncbi:polysaccharide biosynthesis protein, partial [bacterium]